MKKVAIYNKETKEIDYYDLRVCWTKSIIDTQYELIGENTRERIGLQDLTDDNYVIRQNDLVKLLVELDKEFSDVVEVFEDRSSGNLKKGVRIKGGTK